MKRRLIPLLLAAALLITACSSDRSGMMTETTAVPGTAPVFPDLKDDETLASDERVTLWFRFGDEPYLAAETRVLTRLPSQMKEYLLISALVDGPGIRQTELVSPFPEGTRLISAVVQGRTLMVTFSEEFLNEMETGEQETLRRRLALQSLAATVTENCDLDHVIVLVEAGDSAVQSRRLPESWMLDMMSDEPYPAVTRNDALLLTPATVPEILMSCWMQRNWTRMYQYVAASGRPSYTDFVAEMEAMPALISATVTGGSVTLNGTMATCSIQVMMTDTGRPDQKIKRCVMHLKRDNELWKVPYAQLTGWLEE